VRIFILLVAAMILLRWTMKPVNDGGQHLETCLGFAARRLLQRRARDLTNPPVVRPALSMCVRARD
jgi:hypothetical protein